MADPYAWLDDLAAARAAGRPVVLVSVVEARGSVPREPGARLVVDADTVTGSIGGGNLEFRATALARAALGGTRPRLERFQLGPALEQCCGGAVTLLIEPLAADRLDWVEPARRRLAAGEPVLLTAALDGSPRRFGAPETLDPQPVCLWPPRDPDLVVERLVPIGLDILLFGAGHVGRALVQVLAVLPARITWVDDRSDAFPLATGIRTVVSATPEAEVAGAPPGSHLLVMTHDHGLDYRLCAAALRRPDLGLIGLIGSATKRARFARRLAAEGLDPSRLTCPIGLAGIPGKHPGEIAVAVAAQILQRQRHGHEGHGHAASPQPARDHQAVPEHAGQ